MIECSVCGHRNDDLAVLCVSCHGYLQTKVDNLDLFKTIWLLIETPGLAFKKIILANHKNYVILLSSLLGINIAFGAVWLRNLGPRFGNLFNVISGGTFVGIPLGIIFVALLGLLLVLEIKLLKGKARFRNAFAIIAYSSTPALLALIFVFPLEIAIFGVYFFGNNPPPMVLNPQVYIALLGFDALAILWTLLLLYNGIRVLSGFSRGKSLLSTAVLASVPGILSFGLKLF